MDPHEKQFEQAKKKYLEQKYPGNLADVLDSKIGHSPKPDDVNHGSWSWAIALAALIVLGITVGVLLRFSGNDPNGNSTAQKPKPNQTKLARLKFVRLANPVSLDFDSNKRKTKSTIGLSKSRTKALWTTSLVARKKPKTKKPDKVQSVWTPRTIKVGNLKKASTTSKTEKPVDTSSTATKPEPKTTNKDSVNKKPTESLKNKRKPRSRLRFQPIQLFNNRRA